MQNASYVIWQLVFRIKKKLGSTGELTKEIQAFNCSPDRRALRMLSLRSQLVANKHVEIFNEVRFPILVSRQNVSDTFLNFRNYQRLKAGY